MRKQNEIPSLIQVHTASVRRASNNPVTHNSNLLSLSANYFFLMQFINYMCSLNNFFVSVLC
jgi:hypothetical protein